MPHRHECSGLGQGRSRARRDRRSWRCCTGRNGTGVRIFVWWYPSQEAQAFERSATGRIEKECGSLSDVFRVVPLEEHHRVDLNDTLPENGIGQ
ncbi:UNVERIFIED_CONTAM: hypothetical protein GTU68_061111 [Idotea baltica]|nr:hypothetical protein [Idotea baltica]